jgi:signal transduction histidine kinase/ligand-binding sensor domain-containing protein
LPQTVSLGQEYLTKVRNFSTEDGLPTNNILSFKEDSRGYVWIATTNGVNRFDGKNFELFFEEDTPAHTNICSRMAEDVNGNIWIALNKQRGVDIQPQGTTVKIIDANFQANTIADFFGDDLPFSADNILQFVQCGQKGIGIATNDGSIYFYDGSFRLLVQKKELANAIFCVPDYKNQIIYLLIEEEFWSLDKNGNLEFLFTRNFLSSKKDLTGGKEGTKRLFSKGIVSFIDKASGDAAELKFFFQDKSFFDTFISKNILEFTWITTEKETKNLVVHSKNFIALFDAEGNLIYDFSEALLKELNYIKGNTFFQRENQLWFNHVNGFTIIDYRPNPFQPLLKKNIPTPTRSIYARSDSLLFVNTDDGLKKIEFKSDTLLIQHTAEVSSGGWWGLLETSPDFILETGGMDVLQLNFKGHEKNKHISKIKKDSDMLCSTKYPFRTLSNEILVGTECGLLKYNQALDSLENFQQYNGFDELTTANIHHAQKVDNQLWLSTSKGIYVLNEQDEIVAKHQPLANLDTYHFYHENDIFYLATYGQGLVKWNRKTGEIKQYKRDAGFLNLFLTGIYADDFGNLWIATEKGLVKFDKDTENIRVYLKSEGINHNEFNRASHFQASDGKIYFGGLNGYTTFYPKDLLTLNEKSSNFVITKYQELDDETGDFINKTKSFFSQPQICLTPKIKSVRVEFALLNYKENLQNQYAYKIEGWNNNWIHQQENFLKINQLPYGNYTLKIKSKEITGEWNPSQLAIPIIVDVPFYKKTGWQILLLGLLSLLFGLGYRYRLSQARRREKILEKEVANRTKTIRQQLETLKESANIIEEQNAELQLSNTTKDRLFAILAHDLRNPVLSFQSIADSISHLLERNEPERIFAVTNYAKKEANRVYHLLNNLLHWAMIQRKEISVVPSELNLHELTNDVFETNQHIADSTNIMLINLVPEDFLIFGDERILQTIFRNLISNSFKYIKLSGEITVRATSQDSNIVIEIHDNGAGMNKSELDKLFNNNLLNTSDDTKGRIPFGLHLCQELIKLIGGSISASSKSGIGTTFKLTLPQHKTEYGIQ